MKGAYLLSYRPSLFEDACAALAAMGAYTSVDMAQLRDEREGLFTMFKSIEPAWEFREEPARSMATGPLPDMSLVVGCAIECRSEDLFSGTVAVIAQAIEEAVWVLDGDGVLWPADAVDPSQVLL